MNHVQRLLSDMQRIAAGVVDYQAAAAQSVAEFEKAALASHRIDVCNCLCNKNG